MARTSHRLLGFALTASMLAALFAAPSAGAAGDPVAGGRFDLAVSPVFKRLLHKRHSTVAVSGLAIQGGSVDPVSGSGSLKLGGRVKFTHRGRSLVFQNLTATLGPSGSLSGNAVLRHHRLARASTGLFDLSGGSVAREGFGARISGVQASFGLARARGLRHLLGVRLPSASAGSLILKTDPATVEVLGGNATVTQDLSGDVANKLRTHCIDPVNGIRPSGLATQPGGPGTSFQIPVSGGTISPNGWTDGEVDLAGGIDIDVGGPGLPAGCPTSVDATVHLANFAVNVAHKSVLTDFSVSGPYSPFPGMVIRAELQGDTSHASMLADPANHVLTASGATLGLDAGSVMIMNQYLPHASGGVTDFAVGDMLGSASMTVNTR